MKYLLKVAATYAVVAGSYSVSCDTFKPQHQHLHIIVMDDNTERAFGHFPALKA